MDTVYFLANDRVYDLTIAFLNSVRCHAEVPLCLIPFDSQIDRLVALSKEYDFTVFDTQEVLDRCDRLSLKLHPQVLGHYRKLAAWAGCSERFIYIDVDTVVQGDFAPIFQLLDGFDFVFARSGRNGRQWVWKDSIAETRALSVEQLDFAANTGFICSRARELTLEYAEQSIEAAFRLVPHMEVLCFEQAFLNYLVVTSGKRYTSLQELALASGDSSLPLELYAGTPGALVNDGRILRPAENPVLFVHWAGWWRGKPPRITPPGDPPQPTKMPYDTLWNYYRHLRSGVVW